MPRFSPESLSKLQTCHLELQILFFEVIKSVDCTVTCGYRDQAAQEAAYALGNTKLHYPMGNHNKRPSEAVDVYFYPVEMDNTKKFFWFAGIVQGIAMRLKDDGKMTRSIRWGGAWDGLGKINGPGMLADNVHFELTP
jgi:peptidoglycan L-alanyl-D-glutamate endopeptidase CwlK